MANEAVRDVMTVDEVAELARVHPNTVRNLAEQGKLPGRRVGRQWRFSRQAIEEHFGLARSGAPES